MRRKAKATSTTLTARTLCSLFFFLLIFLNVLVIVSAGVCVPVWNVDVKCQAIHNNTHIIYGWMPYILSIKYGLMSVRIYFRLFFFFLFIFLVLWGRVRIIHCIWTYERQLAPRASSPPPALPPSASNSWKIFAELSKYSCPSTFTLC